MKILFVIPAFRNGGVVSALKNLLSSLDIAGVSIDLFAISDIGPNRTFFESLPFVEIRSVPVGNKAGNGGKNSIQSCLYHVVYAIKKCLCKIGIDISRHAFKVCVDKLARNSYDIVVGYQEGQATLFVSLFRNVKKVAWVHCDYSRVAKTTKDIRKSKRLYSSFDEIVCVSEYTKSSFVNLMPELGNKVVAIHNLVDKDRIVHEAQEIIHDPLFVTDRFTIVSLGRIDPVKGFSGIPRVASLLRESEASFRWYIIGGGDNVAEMNKIKSNISLYHVEDCVIVLGNKDNPYPYIRQSQLLVSTSYSEACPNVLSEAFVLGVPVVSTDYGSAIEFIKDGENGYISALGHIHVVIENLIKNRGAYDQLKNNVSCFAWSNKTALKSIDSVIFDKKR